MITFRSPICIVIWPKVPCEISNWLATRRFLKYQELRLIFLHVHVRLRISAYSGVEAFLAQTLFFSYFQKILTPYSSGKHNVMLGTI